MFSTAPSSISKGTGPVIRASALLDQIQPQSLSSMLRNTAPLTQPSPQAYYTHFQLVISLQIAWAIKNLELVKPTAAKHISHLFIIWCLIQTMCALRYHVLRPKTDRFPIPQVHDGQRVALDSLPGSENTVPVVVPDSRDGYLDSGSHTQLSDLAGDSDHAFELGSVRSANYHAKQVKFALEACSHSPGADHSVIGADASAGGFAAVPGNFAFRPGDLASPDDGAAWRGGFSGDIDESAMGHADFTPGDCEVCLGEDGAETGMFTVEPGDLAARTADVAVRDHEYATNSAEFAIKDDDSDEFVTAAGEFGVETGTFAVGADRLSVGSGNGLVCEAGDSTGIVASEPPMPRLAVTSANLIGSETSVRASSTPAPPGQFLRGAHRLGHSPAPHTHCGVDMLTNVGSATSAPQTPSAQSVFLDQHAILPRWERIACTENGPTIDSVLSPRNMSTLCTSDPLMTPPRYFTISEDPNGGLLRNPFRVWYLPQADSPNNYNAPK
ncbi:hypothetical protein AURDEDRAFT_126723 [Auricularia subglabra TFB-10046 SS5]|nr:hypothetical protein AURDEDRAFT_126723 [Auricularia subglabra TFB-10046 SS5]